jgi:hypothetical protein
MQTGMFFRIVGASGLALAALAAAAQNRPPTVEDLGKDPNTLRQEADQKSSQERAKQQQRTQQEADQQWNDTLRQQQSRDAANMAQGEAVRRTWQQRPPLPPERNPLLGRWESLGAAQRQAATGVSPEMAQLANALLGGVTGGMCDSMLGRGTIEFRPTGPVAIGRDGTTRPMYRAEYRGGGTRVVVLPQGGTTFTHMIIDFDGPDRATVAAVGCVLARAGTTKAAMNAAKASPQDGGTALQWTLLGSSRANGGMDVYVARSSIQRAGDVARMTDLFDFKTAQVFEGKSYLSARNQYEYDCAKSRRRMLATTGFSGHMGQGTVVASAQGAGSWDPVNSSGPLHDHWKVACSKP